MFTSVFTPVWASCTGSAAERRVIKCEGLVKLEVLARHLTRRLRPRAAGRQRGLWKLEHMVGNWRRPNQTHYTGDTKARKNSQHSLSHPQGQIAKLLDLITLPPTGDRGGSVLHPVQENFAFLALSVVEAAYTETRLSSGFRPPVCTSVLHTLQLTISSSEASHLALRRKTQLNAQVLKSMDTTHLVCY